MPPADPADSPTPRPGTPDAYVGTEPGAQEAHELSERSTTMIYRRAPRISVFLILGGVIGAAAGIVAGALGSGNVQFTSGQVIGFMLAIGALLGLALGAVAAIVADRFSLRRAREVEARAESSRRSRTEARAATRTEEAEEASAAATDDDGLDDSVAVEPEDPRARGARGMDPDPGAASPRAPQKGD